MNNKQKNKHQKKYFETKKFCDGETVCADDPFDLETFCDGETVCRVTKKIKILCLQKITKHVIKSDDTNKKQNSAHSLTFNSPFP